MLSQLVTLQRPANWLREVYRRNPVLATAGFGALAILPVLGLLAWVDPRLVMGANPWLKPIKFSISFGIYFLTLAWLLEHLPSSRRVWRIISWGSVAMVVLELPVVLLQAARGVRSHFNTETSVDQVMFLMMGIGAFTQLFLLIVAIVLFWKRRVDLPDLYVSGIRWGTTAMVLGILPAIAMMIQNQHAVGVPDGGAGLPIVNWSTEGGDYRIAHFVGMHGMQIFPLLGYYLATSIVPRSPQLGRRLFLTALAGYLLLLAGLSLQAMLGIPLLG